MNYQAPELTRMNKFLLIFMITLFLAHSIGNALGAFSLTHWLGLSLYNWWHVFPLVTFPWIETSLLSVLFNGLVLWFLGSELERQWGEKIYVKFILASILFAGLMYVLLGQVLLKGTLLGEGRLMGMASVSYALCVAYAVLYPDRQFMMMFAFPIKAKWFCLIMVGVEIYMGLFSGNYAAWGHLFAMAAAFGLIRYQNMLLIAWWLKGPSQAKTALRKAGKNHLKLVRSENDDKPTYWH